jgi:hypothetical protein
MHSNDYFHWIFGLALNEIRPRRCRGWGVIHIGTIIHQQVCSPSHSGSCISDERARYLWQKSGMPGRRVDRTQFSRNPMSRALMHVQVWGKPMTTILMIAVGPVRTLNRSILKTERRMSDTGGDDFVCGHCGHIHVSGFRSFNSPRQSCLSVWHL